MNLNKYVAVVISVLISVSCFSQRQHNSENVSVKWGSLEKRKRHSAHQQYLFVHKGDLYTFRYEGLSPTVITFNNELRKQTKFHPMSLSEKSTELLYAFKLRGKQYLFYVETNKKLRENNFYIQEISLPSFSFLNEQKYVGTIKGDYYKNIWNSDVSTFFSPDSSKLAIGYDLPVDFKTREYIVFETGLFTKQYSKKIALSENAMPFFLKKEMVDNSGKIYALGESDIGHKQSKSTGEYRYKFKIHTLNKAEASNVKIELKRRVITELGMAFANGKIVVSGFYSNITGNMADGTLMVNLNPLTNQIQDLVYDDFETDFILSNLSDKQLKQVDKKLKRGEDIELQNLNLDYVIPKNDGGVLLVSEKYFTTQQSYYDPSCRCVKIYTVYHYNDIVVSNLSIDGEQLWSKRIPKTQQSTNTKNFSYYATYSDNKLMLLFNEDPKLFRPAPRQLELFSEPYTGGPSTFSMVCIPLDYPKRTTTETLWHSSESGGYVDPERFLERIGNSIYTYVQGGRGTERYIRIDLK